MNKLETAQKILEEIEAGQREVFGGCVDLSSKEAEVLGTRVMPGTDDRYITSVNYLKSIVAGN